MGEIHNKPSLFLFSGETEAELDTKISKALEALRDSQVPLQDFAYTLSSSSKPEGVWRVAFTASSINEAVEKLEDPDLQFRGNKGESGPQKLCFVFGGYGTSFFKMGEDFYKGSPTYRDWMDYIDFLATRPEGSISAKEAVYKDENLVQRICDVAGITYATSISTAKMLGSFGLKPDIVLGHSIGEYIASVMAGINSVEDMAEIFDWIVSQQHEIGGDGMVVALGEQKIISEGIHSLPDDLKDAGEWVDITAYNAPTQIVLGGSEKALKWVKDFYRNNGVRTLDLPFPQAYHSRGMDPSLPVLRNIATNFVPRSPRCKYISALKGKAIDSMEEDYWVRHIREPVSFIDASRAAVNEGATVFLEVGPGSLTNAMIYQNVENGEDFTFLQTIKKGARDWDVLTSSLAQLFVLGFPIDASPLEGELVPLEFLEIKSVTGNNRLSPNKKLTNEELKSVLEGPAPRQEKELYATQFVIRNIKRILNEPSLTILEDDGFIEMGLGSLELIKMKSVIERGFGDGKSFPIQSFLGCHTPKVLGSKIVDLMTTEDMAETELQKLISLVAEDSILPPHIRMTKIPPVPISQVSKVFLTGATGQLAPYLLEELTKRKEIEKVYCLVRPESNGNSDNRLRRHIESYGLSKSIDMSKIEAIPGNIYEEKMGIKASTYDWLCSEVHAVINCAVISNHLAPYVKEDLEYAGLRAVNVIGTLRTLEFASSGRTKHFYQGSTMLAMWGDFDKIYDKVPELWPGNYLHEIRRFHYMGYSISKFVADDLVYQALRRGIPSKSFRFGKIGGDEKTGRIKVMDNHFFLKFLHYIMSGKMPDLDVPLIQMSVDACAKVSLEVFFNEKAPSDIYNVMPPYSRSELEIAKLGEEFGVQLRVFAAAKGLYGYNAESNKKRCAAKKLLLSTIRAAGDGNKMEDPSKIFKNSGTMYLLKKAFGKPVKILPWEQYKAQLKENGSESLIRTWLDFYCSEDNLFQQVADGKIPLIASFKRAKDGILRDSKAERVLGYERIREIVEDPLDVLRREIKYTIKNAKEVFGDLDLN